MKKNPTTYTFTQRQLWGVAVFAALIILGVSFWYFFSSKNSSKNIKVSEELIEWNKKKDEDPKNPIAYSNENYNESSNFTKTNSNIRYFQFDPNTVSENELIQLGLRPKVAQTIIKYRNKGGKFYKKEDFSKIYTLSDDDYNRLLPYIKITSLSSPERNNYANYNQPNTSNNFSGNTYSQKTNAPVAINTGTVEAFMALKGIGTGYANKIVKYREILGGFHKIEQLKEVYGMTDSLYEAIKPFIIIDNENIKQIAVNTASEEELYKHPYIRKMAKYIVAYRNEIGGFKQIEDFKQVPLINEEIYRKIVPYLSLKN